MAASDEIFVSYSRDQGDGLHDVLRLGELLGEYSLRTWIAARDLPHTSPEGPTIERLRTAPAFIACFGPGEVGRWAKAEIGKACERAEEEPDFVLLAVLLPGSDPSTPRSMREPMRLASTFDLRDGVHSAARLVSPLWRRLAPERWQQLNHVVERLRQSPAPVVLTGGAGSGKSTLATVAMSVLSPFYPAGQTLTLSHPAASIEGLLSGALKGLGFKPPRSGTSIAAFRSRLGQDRYLVAFDEVQLADATELVPPAPSAALILSQRVPTIRGQHSVIELPRPLTRGSPAAPGTIDSGKRPGYNSDTPAGEDLLSIEAPVDALCSVIAAKDVEPPLSIGLFGDWGAGKTFFVEKMQERIAALADASAAAEASAYCSSIRQIDFNAWHYADANLWASLASRVFEGLAGKEDESGRLYGRLASSRLQLKEARAEREAASGRVARAEDEEEAAQREVANAKVALSDLADAAVDVLDEAGEAEPLLSELRETLHLDAGERVTVEVAKELSTVRGAIAALWRSSRLLLVGLGVAVAALVLVLVLAPDVIPVLLAGGTALGLALRLIGWQGRWVVRARAQAMRRTEELQRRQNARLEARLEQLRSEEREARQRQEQARREVEDAEREIAEIEQGQRLFSFIAEKSRGETYEPYMGLVALVRRDFDRLSELIQRHIEDDDGNRTPIERIVLYIDDLDRCPAARVVEVLEAVHLLLASKLFVVVVAVDPRWLLSSLQGLYAEEMSTTDGRWVPTPQDYLEKIFQIPFALPRMEDEGFRRLITDLIPTRNGDGPRASSEGVTAADLPPLPPRDLGGAGESLLPDEDDDLDRDAAQDHAIDIEPEGLFVLPGEVEFMARLGCLVKTPRAAKRLANLYRLVRVSLPEHQLEVLLGRADREAQFPCLQLLLAISIGFPTVSPHLLKAIEESEGSGWWDFVEAWEPPATQAISWEMLRATTEPLRTESFADVRVLASWAPAVATYSYGLPQ